MRLSNIQTTVRLAQCKLIPPRNSPPLPTHIRANWGDTLHWCHLDTVLSHRQIQSLCLSEVLTTGTFVTDRVKKTRIELTRRVDTLSQGDYEYS
jgi:hypothetical protein